MSENCEDSIQPNSDPSITQSNQQEQISILQQQLQQLQQQLQQLNSVQQPTQKIISSEIATSDKIEEKPKEKINVSQILLTKGLTAEDRPDFTDVDDLDFFDNDFDDSIYTVQPTDTAEIFGREIGGDETLTDIAAQFQRDHQHIILDKGEDFMQGYTDEQGKYVKGHAERIQEQISHPNTVSLDNAKRLLRENNNLFVRQAHDMLKDIVVDESRDWDERLVAVDYMLMSNNTELLPDMQNCLTKMIESELSAEDKQKYLANFAGSKHIGMYRNKIQERIYRFCAETYLSFYYNINNPIRSRILAAIYLLQRRGEYVTKEECSKITAELFTIAEDEEQEYTVRTDILDQLINHGSLQEREDAKAILEELRYSGKDEHYTVYDDAENVHNKQIIESVYAFIMDELLKDKIPIQTIEEEVTQEDGTVTNMIYKRVQTLDDILKDFYHRIDTYEIYVTTEQKKQIEESIYRIQYDLTTFTEENVRMAEILQRVYNRILVRTISEREELFKRLIQELVEMSGICTSGHVSRVVNVLSGGFGFDLKISLRDQLIANIKGRYMAILQENIREGEKKANEEIASGIRTKDQDYPCEELGENDLLMGIIPSSSGPDREAFLALVDDNKNAMRNELFSEFVPRYLADDTFEEIFDEGVRLFRDGRRTKTDHDINK